MKKTILFLSILCISFHLYSQSFSSQKGGNCFTIDIPDYMTKTYELNDNSSIQYINISKEAYMIVIEDSKEQLESKGMKFVSPKDFLENFLNDFKKDNNKRKLSAYVNFESNGNKHSQVEFTWEQEGTEFYMLLTIAETNKHFYNIMCWTIMDNKKMLKDDYLKISKSIVE
jgi:hypothetical protein